MNNQKLINIALVIIAAFVIYKMFFANKAEGFQNPLTTAPDNIVYNDMGKPAAGYGMGSAYYSL